MQATDSSQTVQTHILVSFLVIILDKISDFFEFQCPCKLEITETTVFFRLLKEFSKMDNWHKMFCTVPDPGAGCEDEG